MARFVSPITDIKPNGSVRFFDSNTNADKVTYKDDVESIPNELNVAVDANGNLPNIFFSGSAAVIYLDEFGEQYYARNPVGAERELGDFSPWDAAVSYDKNDIVEASDGNIYRSISSGNINNDPTTSPEEWEEIRFIGVWNVNISYSTGDVVQTTDGNLWKAATSNSANNPSSDDGTNWLPAVDGEKIPEVISLDSRTTTVIPQTVGGELTALRVNELQDGGSFDLPLANSVSVNQVITITQPDEFVSFDPVVSRSGSDTITDSNGTDTSITFDNNQSVEIILTSDGVSDWRL